VERWVELRKLAALLAELQEAARIHGVRRYAVIYDKGMTGGRVLRYALAKGKKNITLESVRRFCR
jgi:hypothetical protein